MQKPVRPIAVVKHPIVASGYGRPEVAKFKDVKSGMYLIAVDSIVDCALKDIDEVSRDTEEMINPV